MFPNTIDDDFGEFIEATTLEQNKRRLAADQLSAKKTSQLRDILLADDIRLLCETFSMLMEKFSHSFYYQPKECLKSDRQPNLDYVGAFREKLRVFQQLYNCYGTCLTSRMDDLFYTGMGMSIGISMEQYGLLRVNGKKKRLLFKELLNIVLLFF